MTDGSNSKHMSIEDLLVQKLKKDTLYSLIDDEDALRQLTSQALQKALFSDVIARDSYGHVTGPSRAQLSRLPKSRLGFSFVKSWMNSAVMRSS